MMKKLTAVFFILLVYGCTIKVLHYDKPATNVSPGGPYYVPVPDDIDGISTDTTPGDAVSNLVTPPRGTQDYQIAARAPYDSVLVLSNEWNPLSAKYGLGRWRQLRPLIDSLINASAMSDADWYESGLLTPPDDINDRMYHNGPASVGDDENTFAQFNINQRLGRDTALAILGYGWERPWIAFHDAIDPDYGWTLEPGDESDFRIGNIEGGVTTWPVKIWPTATDNSLLINPATYNQRLAIWSEAGLGCLELHSADNFGIPLIFNNAYDDDWYHNIDDDNGYHIGKMHLAGPTPVPYISITPQSPNEATAQTGGYIQLAQYPNTRDDGTPTTIFGSADANGTVNLYPVTDLPFMDNWNLVVEGTGGSESITDNETVTLNGSGITTVTRSGSTVDINSVEVDGSTTNELQTLANTSDATSHTVTLSNSGGSVQLIEGTGITLTTGGTGLDGTVTIDATSTGSFNSFFAEGADTGGPGAEINDGETLTFDGAAGTSVTQSGNTILITEGDASTSNEIQTLDVSGTSQPITLDLSSDASDPTITGAGINVVTASGNAITITGTEVDGSTSNEIQDITVTGASQPFTVDLSSDATDMTMTGAGITTITRSSNALTFTSTEVDGSTSNELQTISASGAGPTSYNIDLSNSGGSVTLAEGTDINLTRSGNTITVAATSTDDQALTFDGGSGPVGLVIDNVPGSIDFIEGTGISLTSTATTMTITATGGTDSDWLEEGLGTPPNSINDHMYTGTGDHGFGTTTPDRLVHLSATAAGGPFLKMEYSTGTDGNGVMGTQEYFYGGGPGVLVKEVAQKQTNNSNNDATYSIQMKDAGGSTANGIELDQETGLVNDDVRLKIFGGFQAQSWINVSTTQTLDESFFGVRATSSGITLTLPSQNVTNNEHVGTILVIYNTSAGNITIDPGSSSDTVNGSNADITLGTKQSRIFISTNVDGSGNSDWISFN